MRIGVDVGGTFTDVVLVDDRSGEVWSAKVPTTPADRTIGTADAFTRILALSGRQPGEVTFLGHGTTMATNMVVEGKGARTALITTAGFRDILELRRVARHDRADLYDLLFDNPRPLVPRRWRLEVQERLRFDGGVETPLDEAALHALAADIKGSGIEAVAIAFLHAHVNPAHELAAAAAMRRLLPDLFICTSHEVNPEPMEYERTSSTVINAMLGPVCGHYIRSLGAKLADLGFTGDLLFMQSNGGLASPALVEDRPIVLLESGPAGGVSAAIRTCEHGGFQNAILGDMGGTTFDVSLIRGFQPEMRHKSLLHTYVVRTPTIDIDSVGAGGGSIAWIDAGGGVRIGPESAGADPGPACYGRGGTRATVTDCNLVLGYLDPNSFLGGEFRLDVDAAHRAIETSLAKPLGIGVHAAARTVRAIANALMAQAVRIMTVERGFDPREFAFICYGGAGPVHALDLAADLGIRQVIVPPLPGLFSAVGMTVADQQYDYQAPVERDLAALTDTDFATRLATLHEASEAGMRKAGIPMAGVNAVTRADCRYAGQPDVITVTLPENPSRSLRQVFEDAHARLWNFMSPDRAVTVANLRLQLVAPTGWHGEVGSPPTAAIKPGRRRIYLDEQPEDLDVFQRAAIPVGAIIRGPAVVEEHSSCVVLRATQTARVDRHRNLIIDLAA